MLEHSLLPSAGREISSSAVAGYTGEALKAYIWLTGTMHGVSAIAVRYTLVPGSRNSPLARAMNGHILRYGTISSCQSPAISEIVLYKKLSCRTETARRFVSLNISLSSHSRSFEITLLNRACVKVPIHCNCTSIS